MNQISTYYEFTGLRPRIKRAIRRDWLELQGNCCALCDREISQLRLSALDHCHATDKLRGMLCLRCNNMMAAIDRGAVWLDRALAYAQKPGAIWSVAD